VASWKGKTRGGLAGYKLFFGILKFTGLPFAYFFLRFVAFYFFLFSPKVFKPIHQFYRKRVALGFFRSLSMVYRNYYIFGRVLLDKVAVMAGFPVKFSFTFDGEEYLRKMVEERTGGLLISAHIGNFEMAGNTLERLNTNVSIIMYDAEHVKIKDYLDSVTHRKFNVIAIKEDNSHIYEINKAFREKQMVCIHGDRFVKGNKTMSIEFLGEKANFPTGPFYLAMKFNVPVSFVFAMKESATHYHFFATPPRIYQQQGMQLKRDQTIQTIIKDYIYVLEKTIRKYPSQWFNYYNFWEVNDR
jgi:predicted LPLAT superfamily acyltransferase